MLDLPALEIPERTRKYFFFSGETLLLVGVTHFLARESGTHLLRTSDGHRHIVAANSWDHIDIDADNFSL